MTTKKTTKKVATKDNFKPINTETVHFTKDVAECIRNMPEFSGERPLRENHAIHLATEMEEGNFLWQEAGIAVAKCSWDGQTRRVNGNHTCEARLYLDGKSPDIKITTYRARTEEEFRRLYSKFDRNAVRTAGHITNVRLIDTEQFAGYKKTVLSKLSEGYKSWTKESNPDIVADKLLYDHYSVAARVVPHVDRIVNGTNYNYLKRAPVVGAMFETFSKVLNDSEKFWEAVISGLGFESNYDPAKVLREWLQTHTLKNSYTHNNASKTISSEQVYRACILAFNRFRAGKQLQILKPTQTKRRPRAK